MRNWKDLFEDFQRLVVLLTLGTIGEIIFNILRLFGKIEIQGNWDKKKMSPTSDGLLVIYNHPSLWEPGLLPFLFVWHFLFSFSFRFVPYSTPDKKNFFDKWWFLPFRLFCIPIDREKGRSKGLRDIIRFLNQGKIIIVAPEGGRTFKGEEFKILKNDKIFIKKKNELLPEDEAFPKIRRFQRGFEAILKMTKAPVVPIWTQGGDKVIENKEHFPKGPYFLVPNLKEKTKLIIGEKIIIKNIFQLEDILLTLSQSKGG